MAHFIHLLHTLQGTLDNMPGSFLVNDKDEFIIDHDDNFIELAEGGSPGPVPPGPLPSSIRIGAHDYPCTQIGTRLWTTVNLYEPLGNFGNAKYTDSCWVDWNTGSEKGMLYTIGAMQEGSSVRQELAAMLPTGWHLPTPSDFDDLKTAAEGDWRKLTLPEYGGTNELGFNAQLMTPMATNHTSPVQNPSGENRLCKFIMVGSSAYNEFELYHYNVSEQFVMFYDNPAWRICIRVCMEV